MTVLAMYSTSEITTAVGALQPKDTDGSSKEAALQGLLAEFADNLVLDRDAPLYLLRKLRDSALVQVTSARAQVDSIQTVLARLSVKLKPETVDFAPLKSRLQAVAQGEDALSAPRKVGLVEASIDSTVRSMNRASSAGVLTDRKEAYRTLKPALEALADAWTQAKAIRGRFTSVLGDVANVSQASLARQAVRGLAFVEESEAQQAALTSNPRESSVGLLALKGLMSAKASVPDPLTSKLTATASPVGSAKPAETAFGSLSAPYLVPAGASLVVNTDAVGSSTWSLPVSSYATLTTAATWDIDLTAPERGAVTFDLYVDGVLRQFNLAATTYSPAAFAALITAGIGVSASVVGGQVLVRSDSVGDHSTLAVGNETVFGLLGWYVGQKSRGQYTSVSDLLASAGRVGIPYRVSSEKTNHAALGAITANGSTTLTLTVPAGVAVGDSLFLNEEPGIGAYRILSKTSSSVVVDTAVQAGSYTGVAYLQRLKLQSLVAGATSKLILSAGAGASALGLAAGSFYGSTRQLDFGAALTTTQPPVRVGDIVEGSPNVRILSVQGTVVTVETAASTEASASRTITALGASKYRATATALAVWAASESQWKGLSSLSKQVIRILSGTAGVSTADAQLLELEALLESLNTALQLYDAVAIVSVDQALATLKERGLDRALDLITTGQITAFFAMNAGTASYRGNTQAALADLSNKFPLPEGVSLTDVMEDGIADAENDADLMIESDSSDRQLQHLDDDDDDGVSY